MQQKILPAGIKKNVYLCDCAQKLNNFWLWKFSQIFGKNVMLLGKFSLLEMAKHWTNDLAIWSSAGNGWHYPANQEIVKL